MPDRFAGKVAVVTGGASGLGKATATRLVAEGARVVIVDLDADLAGTLADALGDAAASYRLDITGLMRERGGAIVNVASANGVRVRPAMLPYSAS